MISSDIAVDLGSATIRIFTQNKGLVLEEPAIMAVDVNTKNVVAIGDEAYNMLGRTGENIDFKRPFERGIVTDLTMAEYMIARYIKKIGIGKFIVPSVAISTPSDITEVQKHAISDVFERSGIRKISFVDDAIASVRGSGLNVKSSIGVMSINIGHSHTTSTVMAGGKVISQERVNMGGEDFTNDFVKFMRKQYNMEIGPITAENAKREIGSVSARERVTYYHVKGKNILKSLPCEQIVSSDETVEIFSETMTRISDIIQKSMEKLPVEVLGDIVRGETILSGGGAKLFGVDKYLSRKLNIKVTLCESPENAIINGISQRKVTKKSPSSL